MAGTGLLKALLSAAILSMAAVLAAPMPTLAQSSATDDRSATSAAVTAAQLLIQGGEYQAARELLRSHVADPRAALIFVRSGIALGVADADDAALMTTLSERGDATASRILGDLQRIGAATGGDPDLAAAEAAYRRGLELGDKASELRLAQLFSQAARYPEAIAAFEALLDDFPEQESRYLTLKLVRGELTNPAEIAPLVARLDALSETDALAARTAATIHERGIGVERDPALAVHYAKRAVSLGATDVGIDAADCETCSMLDVVALLKGARVLDPKKTAATLERAIGVGLYGESFEIFRRFDKPVRDEMTARFVNRYSAISNPVVGFTQALLAHEGAYRGALDGQLGPATLAAVGSYARSHGITVMQFDMPLVLALFDRSQ